MPLVQKIFFIFFVFKILQCSYLLLMSYNGFGILYIIHIRISLKKIVTMIRKYHNHKPQTTPWYREEEPLNHHETQGRQIKQSNQLSLPHQDDFATLEWT